MSDDITFLIADETLNKEIYEEKGNSLYSFIVNC